MSLVPITVLIHEENLEALTVPYVKGGPPKVDGASLAKLDSGEYRLIVPSRLCPVTDAEDQRR